MRCATVGQVVAVHRRYHGMAQPQAAHRLNDAANLAGIDGRRASGFHVAEFAGASASVAANHESGSAVVPTLAAIGTQTRSANGVQAATIDVSGHTRRLDGIGQLDAQPLGLTPVKIIFHRYIFW
jgi:hypothetical protein